jgi:hypothetical protein
MANLVPAAVSGGADAHAIAVGKVTALAAPIGDIIVAPVGAAPRKAAVALATVLLE